MAKTMREHLYRAKRAYDRKWSYGVPLQHCDGDCQMISGKVGAMITDTIIPETIGQFTGLTDKNGVKIFEGDIIKAIWRHLGSTDTVVGSVVFTDASFVLETKEHFLFFEDNIFAVDCEVVGNVHDTPELLK